jgi:hypothetical protein
LGSLLPRIISKLPVNLLTKTEMVVDVEEEEGEEGEEEVRGVRGEEE